MNRTSKILRKDKKRGIGDEKATVQHIYETVIALNEGCGVANEQNAKENLNKFY